MSDKPSLSGAEFPPARNEASARDLKPVPVVSSKTGHPHQVLPSDPILSPATIAVGRIKERSDAAPAIR
ncbi:MAG: hypothetical protein HQ518_21570 [Rhodopirellula sp.]|nr:hypothetical protein [Rhodopirellula sp.]